MHQRTYKSNPSNSPSQEKGSQFFRHSSIVQAKQNSYAPPTQEEMENNAFAQNKFEVVGLQIKQTNGTITPIEQERLGVLQAKMDDVLAKRVERAERFGHHLANIPLHSPDRPVSAPVQSKLPFGLSRVVPETNPQRYEGHPISPKLTIGRPKESLQQIPPNETLLATMGECVLQSKSDTTSNLPEPPVEVHPNKTGLPDQLKAGIENLSGYSMDDVRVHYNSDKPSQLQAHAYTQGAEIHIAPGQEKHLPHEAWHVVQQMQGRVKETRQLKGVGINDDMRMEREAELMGDRAKTSLLISENKATDVSKLSSLVIQRISKEDLLNKVDIGMANMCRNIYDSITMPSDIINRAENIASIITKFEPEVINKYFLHQRLIEIFVDGLISQYDDEKLIKEAAFYFQEKGQKVPDEYQKYLNRFTKEEIENFLEKQTNFRKEEGQPEASKLLSERGEKMHGEFKNIRWVGSGPDPNNNNLPAVDKKEKGKNNFAEWIYALVKNKPNADKFAPTPSGHYQMNCWEGVMFTAYKAGLVNEKWLLEIHKEAAESGIKYFDSLAKSLGFDNAIPYDPMNNLTPEAGDIVFFGDMDGSKGMDHVALSLGGEDLLHLWHSTEGGNSTFEKTTFKALFFSRKDFVTRTWFAPAPFKKNK